MELSSQDKWDLELLEEGLWRADVRFDRERMDGLLAPDFFEFGRSGRVHRREATLSAPAQPIVARLPLSDFRARLPDANLAQVTYVSTVTYQGIDERSTRISLWSRTKHGWQLRFHQGTAIPGCEGPTRA